MSIPASTLDVRFRNHTEFYYDAFAAEQERLWRGYLLHKGTRGSAEEVYSLCYYRALTCFMRRTYDDIRDRRKLLYAYLSGDFATGSEEDTLNRLRSVLPTGSIVPRVLRLICTAYDDAPKRAFSEDLVLNGKMEQLYKDIDVQPRFQRAYKAAKLCGIVAVMPYVIEGEWFIDIMTPDQFRIVTDPNNYNSIVKFTYVRCGDNGTNEFISWTALTMSTTDANGKETVSDNPLGVIPVAFLRLEESDAEYTGGMFDLVESNLKYLKSEFIADLNATYAGSPVWIGLNMGKNIKIGPDKVISLSDVTVGEGENLPPELTSVTPEQTYDPIMEFARKRKQDGLMEYGIPSSMTSANATTPLSGIARIVERQEIIEARYEDQPSLQRFERDFARLVADIANSALNTGINVDALQVSVEFAEERILVNPEQEYTFDRMKVADGAMDYEDFYAKWGNIKDNAEEIAAIRIEKAASLGFVREAIKQSSVVSRSSQSGIA